MGDDDRALLPDFLRAERDSWFILGMPIAGIRSSAAHVFCEWLTANYGITSKFRLPAKSESDANPLVMPALKSPMHYWVSDGKTTSATPACEMTGNISFPNVVGIIEADLAFLVNTDLDVLGWIERWSDLWNASRLRRAVILQMNHVFEFGPAVNVDAIAKIGNLELRTKYHDRSSDELAALFAVTYLASAIQLQHRPDLELFDNYFEAIARTAEHVESSLKREERLARHLIALLVVNDSRWEKWCEGAGRSSASSNLKLASGSRSNLGAAMQSWHHRAVAARNLAAVYPIDDLMISATKKQYLPLVEGYPDKTSSNDLGDLESKHPLMEESSVRARILIRLLALILTWRIVLSDASEDEKGLSGDDLRRGTQLLRLHLDLCFAEERISGTLPPVEGIRIVRETRTDTLESIFDSEERAKAQQVT
jgi:hypothetical protein